MWYVRAQKDLAISAQVTSDPALNMIIFLYDLFCQSWSKIVFENEII